MTAAINTAGQLPPSGTPDNTIPITMGNVTYYEDGGDPIYLNQSVYLCARADQQGDRFFSGSIAQAGFYNEALNASSIVVSAITCTWFLFAAYLAPHSVS